MPNLSKKQITILIIVVSVVVLVGAKFGLDLMRGQSIEAIPARAKGDPKANVKVVEYIDFQCPACAYGEKYLRKVMDLYDGEVYIQIKYFPLGTHRHAFTAAWYTECAAQQGQFWPYLETLLDRQSQWKRLWDAEPAFHQIVQEMDLDVEKFKTCLSDQDVKELILSERNKGNSLGVKSTPTYFVNDKMVVGARSLHTELKALINVTDELLR